MSLGDIGYIVGVLGLLFGANCYYHLWRWARDCQYARIAISFKGKVALDAPLVEWLLWSRKVRKDIGRDRRRSKGRVVYRQRETAVAVTAPLYPTMRTVLLYRKCKRWYLKKRGKEVPGPSGPRSVSGVWGENGES